MSEPFFTGNMSTLPVPLASISPEGLILEANKTFFELLVSTANDVVGRPLSDFAAEPASLTELHEQTLHIGPARGRKCRLRDRNGHEIPVGISTQPRRGEKGTKVGYVAAIFDLRQLCQGRDAATDAVPNSSATPPAALADPEELRSAREKLTAAEQKLTAAEQKLTTTEQKLTAAEQKLTAETALRERHEKSATELKERLEKSAAENQKRAHGRPEKTQEVQKVTRELEGALQRERTARRAVEESLARETAARAEGVKAVRALEAERNHLRDSQKEALESARKANDRYAREVAAHELTEKSMNELRQKLAEAIGAAEQSEAALQAAEARHEAEAASHRQLATVPADAPNRLAKAGWPTLFFLDREGRFAFHHTPGNGKPHADLPEILGRNYSDVLPAHITPLTAEALTRNQQSRIVEYEYPVPNGRDPVWFSARLTPVMLNGNYAGSFVEMRDITNRKREERRAEIERLHQEFESRISKLHEAVAEFDALPHSLGRTDTPDAGEVANGPGNGAGDSERLPAAFPLIGRDDYIAELPEATLQLLNQARAKVEQAGRLIDDLVTQRKAENGDKKGPAHD